MELDGFWELIERSQEATSDQQARLQWLEVELARRPPAEIIDFYLWLDRTRRRADTWQMWGAAYLICDGLCSDDGFWYFQLWLVGLGREAFELAVEDPDNLAGVAEVVRLAGRPTDAWQPDEWPDWESLDYVAVEAYEQVTGSDIHDAAVVRDHDWRSSPRPSDARWDFEDPVEAARRLPRLSWMFPLTDRATRDQRGREAFEGMLAERGQTEEEFIAQFLGPNAGRLGRGDDPVDSDQA